MAGVGAKRKVGDVDEPVVAEAVPDVHTEPLEPPFVTTITTPDNAEATALALVGGNENGALTSAKEAGAGAWKKNKWNAEEDAQLTRLVNAALESEKNKGDKKASARGIKWEAIGAEMEGRTGKQCREHWVNVLAPEVDSKAKWSPQEDIAIKAKVAEMGTCWSELVKQFPGRTSLAIKNRWNSMKRKEERLAAKGEAPPPIPPPALQITAMAEPSAAAEAPAEGSAPAGAEDIPIATATVAAITVDTAPTKPAKLAKGTRPKTRGAVEEAPADADGGAASAS
ncbi:hypothetical protein AB1Y20_006381 [Prymnesium parvum]|uniref:Uncharacterized protein n=1 Tax=Prymnesium parvum TaxID=97485 RepID=A0AB34J2I2_PRYPA|mmetsp:Transcript_9694/g.24038  ORF Transcript_9694/g.24038 Transcript_9694/m.24038 type:complete len:283 (+) Transcript_9694:77-925(+)